MGYIYYDTETTGLAKEFDQILQFSALLTNDDTVEINQILDEINLRCRRLPHVVPAPSAMQKTRLWPSHIENAEFSHYEMMKRIQDWVTSHGSSVLKGHNIIEFDEKLLRYGFLKSLLPLYMTNTGGNQRGDTRSEAHAAYLFAPKAVFSPLYKNKKGKDYRSFSLGALISANRIRGDLDNAHDAMADTHMARNLDLFLRQNAPHVWERMYLNQYKVDVQSFLEESQNCVYGQFVHGKVYPRVAVPIGVNPIRETEYAVFDVLKHDPETYEKFSVAELADIMMGSKKPIYVVPMNKQPILGPLEWYPPYVGTGLGPDQKPLTDEDKQRIQERTAYLQGNFKLRWKIKLAMQLRTQYYEEISRKQQQDFAQLVARETTPDSPVPGIQKKMVLPAGGIDRITLEQKPRQRSLGASSAGGQNQKPANELKFLPRAKDPIQSFCRNTLDRRYAVPLRNVGPEDAKRLRIFRDEKTSWDERGKLVEAFEHRSLKRMAALEVFTQSPESLTPFRRDVLSRWASFCMRKTQPEINSSFEDHIYDGFPSPADMQRMFVFHDEKTTWEKRADMIGQFEKPHYNEIAALIVYSENPGSLPLQQRNDIAKWIHERITRQEELTREYEEKVREFLTGNIHERIDMVGTLERGDFKYVDFSAFNNIMAVVSMMDASPEMRELYMPQVESWCGSYGNESVEKFIGTYRTRFIGPDDARSSYKDPTSRIRHMTVGKALVDVLFLKYEGAYEVLDLERKIAEVRLTKPDSPDLVKMTKQRDQKRKAWESKQPQINAIFEYILDLSKEPEMAEATVLFESKIADLPENLKAHIQPHLPEQLRGENRIPLDVLLGALVTQLEAQSTSQAPSEKSPLPGGEIPQSDIVVPVPDMQVAEEKPAEPVPQPAPPVRKPRKPKTAPQPVYRPRPMPDHLL